MLSISNTHDESRLVPLENAIPVSLTHCPTYANPVLETAIGDILDAADLHVSVGSRVLVKPNMVAPRALACTTPAVVAGVCAWLLDRGAVVSVADSPGIGRATGVARAIGLDSALHPLGIAVQNFEDTVTVRLPLAEEYSPKLGDTVSVGVARLALESDMIVSMARLKAHRFTLLTMAVKNCFGCVPGVRKALMHMFHGKNTDFFADCLAAIWAVLPPVAGVIDAIECMHHTGPIKGHSVSLGLLGASRSAVALDAAVAQALGVSPKQLPLAQALRRRNVLDGKAIIWPLQRPNEFDCSNFILPRHLDSAWFHPFQILRSVRSRVCSWFQK